MVLGEKAVNSSEDLTKGEEVITSGSITRDDVNELAKTNSSSSSPPTSTVTYKNFKVIVDGQEKNSLPPTPPASDQEKKLRVLIVDDQSFTRLLHMSMVNSLGLDAELAENGKVAVDLHQSGASFDLILMDRDMPVMNGAEATKELRAMGVETNIVGVTAHEDGLKLQEFVEAGLNECYAKPISVQQIADQVKLVKEDKN